MYHQTLSLFLHLHNICAPLRTILGRHKLFNICLAQFLAIISCQRQGLALGYCVLPQTCVPANRVIASRAHLCL